MQSHFNNVDIDTRWYKTVIKNKLSQIIITIKIFKIFNKIYINQNN